MNLSFIDFLACVNFLIGLTNFDLNDSQHVHLEEQDKKIDKLIEMQEKILKILEGENERKIDGD